MSETLFQSPYLEFTAVKNAIFDQLMPMLSSDAWKVLCVALRLTWGGDAVAGGALPRINIDEFTERSGITDRAAVEAAVAECVDAGCLTMPTSDELVFDFVLNVGPEALAALQTASPVVDDAPAAVADDRIIFPAELESALDRLVDFARETDAVPNPNLVQRAVIESGADAVDGWIAAGRLMTHLDPPARFQTVLDRLLQGVPPLPLSMLEADASLLDDTAPPAAAPTEPQPTAAPDLSAMTAPELWQSVLKALRPKMRSSKYKFLAPTVGVALEGDVLTVGAANERVREWLESGQLADVIRDTFQSVAGETAMLKFVVQEG